mgnify:CR=1 FL=1
MPMVSKDDNKPFLKIVLRSFGYAIEGISFLLKKERNFKIQLFVSMVVIFASIFFQISKIEWIIVILLMGGMLCIEALNTAIEKTVDLVTEDVQPLAKIAKDASAGAALIFASISVIIGLLIFLPYVIALL